MAESIRMQQLKKLSGQMPVANQQVASGLQQAAATQMQAAIQGAKPGMGAGTAQQAGATAAAAQAQPLVQAQQQNQQQVNAVANMAQNQAGIQAQQQIGQAQSAVNQTSREYAARLNEMNNDVKNQLLDDQLKFAKDERGRTMLNDRQIADVAILRAKNAEELATYKQGVDQMNQRKLQAMQAAYHKLEQAMKTGYNTNGQVLDFKTKQELKTMMTEAEKAMAAEKNRIESNNAMWSAAGTIVGTVVGGIFGGAAGAKGGGQAGGAAGGYAGSQG